MLWDYWSFIRSTITKAKYRMSNPLSMGMNLYLQWKSLVKGTAYNYTFPEVGVAHSRDQQFGYPAYTTVIQLQPTAPHILRTAHRS